MTRSGTLLVYPGLLYVQDACARVQEIFRAKNPDAAVLFDEGCSWDGQQEGVNVIIGSIIERSTDTALLDEIIRRLREKLFARGVRYALSMKHFKVNVNFRNTKP